MTADGGDGTSIDSAVLRTCIGCRARRSSAELVRCTMRDGVVTVDGPSDGRGAWLCRRSLVACASRALAQRGFQRAWRTELDEHISDQIERRIAVAAGGVTGDAARSDRAESASGEGMATGKG